MKIKAKLELFFATKRISDILKMYEIEDESSSGVPFVAESWINDLVCSITDSQLLHVIRSAFGGASCSRQ